MESPKVRRLYKYAPLNERTLATLLTNRLWYASPATFNDPFDSSVPDVAEALIRARERKARGLLSKRISISGDPTLDKALAGLAEKFVESQIERARTLADSIKPVVLQLRESFHSFGVLCLSEDPTNILMWSHYAAQHTGLCLGLQRTSRNKLGKQAQPVQYSRRRLAGAKVNPLYQKHSGWSYEREWRDIQKTGDALYASPGEIVELICGSKMSPTNIDLVQRIVASVNADGARIQLRYASMHHTRFLLQLSDVPAQFER